MTDGFWSIIVPEATTNLVTNPSIEIDTTGYTAVGSAISRNTGSLKRETASLRIVPTAAVNDGAYYGTVSLTNGQTYTFSLDVWALAYPYKIYFADTSGVLKGTATTFTGISDWDRQEVTWTCDSTASYRLYIIKDNSASTFPFFIDGVQCENLAYATTYIDGNQEGGKWAGVEHASTSERDAQSRLGGRVYNLDDYGFYIDDMPGIGMPPILHQTQEQPMLPGSLLRGFKTKPRIFDLIANQIGTTHEDLHSKRKDLLNAIKPDLVLEPQPFILRYTGANANKPIEIRCVYDSGYQFTKLDGFVERDLPLRFIAYDQPYFQEIGNTAKILTTNVSVTNANRIIRKIDSVWSEMDQGANGAVYAIAKGLNDGYIYIGGLFSSVGGGISNTGRMARWDGSTWSAMGLGAFAGAVNALAIASDGSVYIGGTFAEFGGVSNTGYIARWDGSSWNAVGTGMDDEVKALAIDQDGILYAAGDFLDAGGTAVNRIASWNGSSWSAMGTGCSATVYALAIAINNNLYVGGDFVTAGGTTVNHIAEWDGSSWAPLLSATGMNAAVYAIAVKDDGKLAAMGGFSIADGVPANYIAIWNGAIWSALQSGFNTGSVGSLHWIGNLLYASGAFTEAGGIDVERIAIWNGTTWTHFDANLPGTPTVYTILFDGGDIYFGYSTSGTATTSYSHTVTNDGTRTAYPKIVIERSGGTAAIVKWLKNETAGVTIYLDYSLQDGESLILELGENKRSLTSSYKGNIWQAALRSSDIADFSLLPGDNNISVYVYETGSPTVTAYMQWRNTHWSADGVAI